jgi:hypothetical protein
MNYLIRKVFAETTQFVVVHKHRGQTFDPNAVTYNHRISRATLFKDRRDAERWVSALSGTTMGTFTIIEVPD